MGALSVSDAGVQSMTKESFVDVKSRITRDEFRTTFAELDKDETIKKFNLSLANFSYLVHYYEAEDIVEELKQKKRKFAYQQKAEKKLQLLKDRVPKDKLVKIYITENNSLKETANYFNVSEGNILQLISLYDCRKPKTVSKITGEKTKEQRYGSSTYNNREQAVKTCLERYGVENPAQVQLFMEHSYDTKCSRYGSDNPNNWKQGQETRIKNSGSLENSYKITTEHRQAYCLEHYGVDNVAKLDYIKKQIGVTLKETFQERYGADCYWLTKDAIRSNGSKDSSYNIKFATSLDSAGINYSREVTVGSFIYDFQIGNYLIEVNPTPTHNVTWSPYSDTGIARNYHQLKSKNALDNGYRCIHVWDWDNIDKIINLLLTVRDKIYARKCTVKLVSKEETKNFINSYHLQGYANDTIRLGLYYNNELVSMMTFGNPRYTKKVQYELIRYCSSRTIVGGANKLFNYFIQNYQPQSIVSYCDTSKFEGAVYKKLGFEYLTTTLSSHWYNLKTGQHILDSLLRSRGFDQLFGTNYGKGTSNKELIIQHGFLEVVDSGQSTYIWNNIES